MGANHAFGRNRINRISPMLATPRHVSISVCCVFVESSSGSTNLINYSWKCAAGARDGRFCAGRLYAALVCFPAALSHPGSLQ